MALLMAMRRASFSSILFTKLINRSAMVAPTLSIRSFNSSVHIIDSNDENGTINAHGGSFTRSYEFPIQHGVCDQYTDNPFQISGPQGAYEAKKVEDGFFVRMEMPGIDKQDVRLWVEYGNVYIKGEGKKESNHEDSGRTYSGSVELSSSSFQPEKIMAEMKNGVLRMVIPKRKKYEEMSGVVEVKIK
ncbi:unnamed protein product [Ilex paraguariensis]|uniref:SHSP domain-containing protein n=1 Tax=Ilex paraguariensis TaxID=185542 RepID=A0ABC8ULK3_9AQUA